MRGMNLANKIMCVRHQRGTGNDCLPVRDDAPRYSRVHTRVVRCTRTEPYIFFSSLAFDSSNSATPDN